MHDSSDDPRHLSRPAEPLYDARRAPAYELGKSAGVFHLLLSPMVRFLKFYVLRLGFSTAWPAAAHSIGCMNSYMKYAKLLELRRLRPGESAGPGAAGFIGMHCAERLLRLAATVIGIDNLSLLLGAAKEGSPGTG